VKNRTRRSRSERTKNPSRDPAANAIVAPQGAPGRRELLLPRLAEVDVPVALRDRRGDLGQELVFVALHAGVHAEDEIGAPCGDRLDVELLGADRLRRRPVQCLLRPGAAGDVDAALERPGADRNDAEGEREVLIVEAGGDREQGQGGTSRVRMTTRLPGVRAP
jgi:hypothetical protein